MLVHILTLLRVELDALLFVLEEQLLDVAHLIPSGAAFLVLRRDADVLPKISLRYFVYARQHIEGPAANEHLERPEV